MSSLSPELILQYIDELLQKEVRPCPNRNEHTHVGRVDCHPAPPQPGSYHRNPNIRHDFSFPGHGSSDPSANPVPSTPVLDKLKEMYREDVILDEQDRQKVIGLSMRAQAQGGRLDATQTDDLNRLMGKYQRHYEQMKGKDKKQETTGRVDTGQPAKPSIKWTRDPETGRRVYEGVQSRIDPATGKRIGVSA